MKNLNKKPHYLKKRMNMYYGSAALIALMCATSVSHAMNPENAREAASDSPRKSPRKPSPVPRLKINPGELQAGGNQNQVKLIQKKLLNESTGKEKPVFQFVDINSRPLPSEDDQAPYYEFEDLKRRLQSTEKVYNDAIRHILKNGHRAIRINLNMKERKIIEPQLIDYFDRWAPGNERNFNDTYLDLNHYMTLCNAIYTDYTTRGFVSEQHLECVENKWNDVISIRNNISNYRQAFEVIRNGYRNLVNAPVVFVPVPGAFVPGAQVPNIEAEQRRIHLDRQTAPLLQQTNAYLQSIKRQIIKEKYSDIDGKLDVNYVIRKLKKIQGNINSKYFWFFEKPADGVKSWTDKTLEWFYSDNKIHFFEDSNNERHQFTAKAVISTSFLAKSGLLDKENITILDVGFRNQETFGGLWNTFATGAAVIAGKSNRKAWFLEKGEVDYIAYLEKDPSPQRKDKLIIVYSGSNSAADWGVNFTPGHSETHGLSVHKGIGWLFEKSVNTSHHVLMNRINNYYHYERKPNDLEIITTGHSLGAALAEQGAFYYKTNTNKFKSIISPEKISVKTFSFGAPAIIHESSKNRFEKTLGINNIYRVWTDKDVVVNYTVKSSVPGWLFQGGVHVGKSFPLTNIENHKSDWFDWWGPHGATRYIGRLSTFKIYNFTLEYKEFTEIINNYFKTSYLDIYKTNRREVQRILENFNEGKTPDPINLSQGLAEHIMKYSPTTVSLKPPTTVGEIQAHSPRYAAALSPRFEVEVEDSVYKTGNKLWDRYEIKASFTIDGKYIELPIVKSTPCSITDIQNYAKNNKGVSLNKKSAEELSCGCYMAKHIFVSQYTDSPSYYHGSFGYTAHKDTLTKMLSGCVEEKACSATYMKETSQGKNIFEQVAYILGKVGLREAFTNKKVYFSRFEKQDQLTGEKRPGVDITEHYREPESMFHKNRLLRWMTSLESEHIEFSKEELLNKDSIYRKIINSVVEKNINNFNSFFDIQRFQKILAEHLPEERKKLFNNFKTNFVTHLTAYSRQKLESGCCAGSTSQSPPINTNNLESALRSLEKEVLENIWILRD